MKFSITSLFAFGLVLVGKQSFVRSEVPDDDEMDMFDVLDDYWISDEYISLEWIIHSYPVLLHLGGIIKFTRDKEWSMSFDEADKIHISFFDNADYFECLLGTLEMLATEPRVKEASDDFLYTNKIVQHYGKYDTDLTITFLDSKDELKTVCDETMQYYIEASSPITCKTEDDDVSFQEKWNGVALCIANIPACTAPDFILDLINDLSCSNECSYEEVQAPDDDDLIRLDDEYLNSFP